MSANPNPNFLKRSTPGIYITEIPAFGNSVVGVATAVPIFIGYTEFAADPISGKPLYMTAVPLASMSDYTDYFGGDYETAYVVMPETTKGQSFDFQTSAYAANPPTDVTLQQFVLQSSVPGAPVSMKFQMYTAMRLFFANGGGQCFVVSVSDYWGSTTSTGPQSFPPANVNPTTIDPAQLVKGLGVAQDTQGPTMIVVPSLCTLLDSAYGTVAQAMLKQAGTLQDRVAILDTPGALDPASWQSPDNSLFTAQITSMSVQISPMQAYSSYGAAYGPALQTTIFSVTDYSYLNLSGSQDSINWMNNILTIQALTMYTANSAQLTEVQEFIGQAFPATAPTQTQISTAKGVPPTTVAAVKTLSNNLANALPLYAQVLSVLATSLNAAPPSGAMAGVWSASDTTRGVWNAPANVSLAAVSQPKVAVTAAQQGPYNMPLDGHSVTILRQMPSRGTVVWGARTLDGNSNDFRYIQVRRTLIYLEQSIQAALQPFVFAANDASTWVSVTSMISSFLTGLWQSGGLTGSKPSEAFAVNCGVNSTMSPQDVLDGYMVVAVSVALVHPAEFIELTFTQMLQSS